jgi:ATP-binding cassette, subfamily C, bacteriocin exporter
VWKNIRSLFAEMRVRDGEQKNSSLKDSFRIIIRLLPYIKPLTRHYVITIVIESFCTTISLFLPFIPKLIIDHGVGTSDIGFIINVLLIGFFIGIVTLLLRWFSSTYKRQLSYYIVYNSKISLIKRLSKISPSSSTVHRSGDIISRTNGLATGVEFIFSSVESLVSTLIRLITLPAILAMMDWRILLFGFPSIIFSIIVWFKTQKYLKILQRREAVLSGSVSSVFFDVVSSLPELQLSNLTYRAIHSYSKEYVKHWRVKVFSSLYSQLLSSMQHQVSAIFILALSIFGWNEVIGGAWTIGMMSTIVFSLNYIQQPIIGILSMGKSLVSTSVFVQRYFDIHDAVDIKKGGDIELKKKPHSVILNNVSFSYNVGSKLLDNISLSIFPGKPIAISGDSGSGKTTLLKIIAGLLEYQNGHITVDGTPFEEMNLEKWRSQIASLSQNTYFFPGSLYENICFGSSPSKERIQETINLCCLDKVASRLKLDGIGEGGRSLSSGEKQRVALARNLLINRPVVFLDEPLSQVDIPTSEKIFDSIFPIISQKTCIIVTHNPLIMKRVDKLYSLYKGQLFQNTKGGI